VPRSCRRCATYGAPPIRPVSVPARVRRTCTVHWGRAPRRRVGCGGPTRSSSWTTS
jgi:hypothetical protein